MKTYSIFTRNKTNSSNYTLIISVFWINITKNKVYLWYRQRSNLCEKNREVNFGNSVAKILRKSMREERNDVTILSLVTSFLSPLSLFFLEFRQPYYQNLLIFSIFQINLKSVHITNKFYFFIFCNIHPNDSNHNLKWEKKVVNFPHVKIELWRTITIHKSPCIWFCYA